MRTIGKYEIRARLGSGAMGAVYKVIIPRINKLAALKCLEPSPALVEKMGATWVREQFIREATLIANIRHPNVVEVWSMEEEDGRLFYLMEYFCHNLGNIIGERYWVDAPTRMMPIEKAVGYGIGTLDGVFRLHQTGIIHRDIKPFNIMLTDAGVPKIVDFGLSKRRGEVSNRKDELKIGTLFYAAPELMTHPDTADHRADLFSVGMMLQRMLTGSLSIRSPEHLARLTAHLNPALKNFLLKATSPNPENRFPDASAMAEGLQRAYTAFQREIGAACRWNDSTNTPPGNETRPADIHMALRSDPGRITANRARAVFDLNDLSRPNAYIKNDLVMSVQGVVLDKTTGLLWQQAGSAFPMPWAQAGNYIRELNSTRFGGIDHWRLPTVNEILSLMIEPPPGEDYCFDSPFSKTQKWVWSGDSRSKIASWAVNAEMGFVISHDVMDCLFTKGVCTP